MPSEIYGRPSAQVTPLVVNGQMYLTAGNRMVALVSETGKEIWNINSQGGGGASARGVAFWPCDRDNPPSGRLHFRASTDYAECEKGDTEKTGLSSL